MCGIAGLFAFARQRQVDAGIARRMADVLRHRGPDGSGVRSGPGYALAHRRLAIVDLAGGAQPMSTPDERLWITYNGEIYNFQQLREGLISKGHTLRSGSDSECLPHLYEEYGDAFVDHLRGMFAVAVWDRYLAYGAALGALPHAADVLDIPVARREVLLSPHRAGAPVEVRHHSRLPLPKSLKRHRRANIGCGSTVIRSRLVRTWFAMATASTPR